MSITVPVQPALRAIAITTNHSNAIVSQPSHPGVNRPPAATRRSVAASMRGPARYTSPARPAS